MESMKSQAERSTITFSPWMAARANPVRSGSYPARSCSPLSEMTAIEADAIAMSTPLSTADLLVVARGPGAGNRLPVASPSDRAYQQRRTYTSATPARKATAALRRRQAREARV